MLKKLLNPFGIKFTDLGPLYIWPGIVSAVVLHLAFYFTIFHFIRKFW